MISLKLLTPDTYALKILPGGLWKKDMAKVSDLPDKQAQWWEDSEGLRRPLHYEIPRSDIGEISRRWHAADIICSDRVRRDFRIYGRVSQPLADDDDKITGELADFGTELREHQEELVRLSPRRRRLLLSFSTGQGKSLGSLARAKILGAKKILVISIQNVMDDWPSEIRKAFGEEPLVYLGTKKAREKQRQELKNHKFVFTTYDVAHELVPHLDFDFIIFDEADFLHNPDTLRAQRLEPIVQYSWEKNTGFLLLTATAMGNRVTTLWNMFRMVHPFLAGSRKAFQLRYERATTRKLSWVTIKTPTGYRKEQRMMRGGFKQQNLDELQQKLSCFMVIKDSADSAPYRDDTKIIRCNMTATQRSFYNEFEEKLSAIYEDRIHLTAKEARTKVMRLLQIAEGIMNLDPTSEDSGKLDKIRRILDKSKKKVIVWSRFKPMTYMLYKLYQDRAVFYNGDLNKEQKKLSKWAFAGVKDDIEAAEFRRLKEKYGCKFEPGEAQFFFSILHGTTARGMNLQICAIQIFSSFSFSGVAMQQAKGRICRIGQRAKRVRTRYLISYGTCEESALQYALDKCATAKMTLTGEDLLSRNQIDAILRIAYYNKRARDRRKRAA